MIKDLHFENPRVFEDTYFRAEETFPGIFVITQPWHKPDSLPMFCYLIVGTKAAIVYDSMLGYGNLRKFCETVTDLPLLMVNSHFHGDHAAGNFDFDCCYIHPYDLPGIYHGFAENTEEMYRQAVATSIPEFIPNIRVEDMCAIRPMKTFPIFDGDVFDIGDRELTVVHVGGHSPGSIMLLDPVYHVAFSGDTCNNDTLLLNGDSIREYLGGILHLRKFTAGILYCFGGHESFPASVIDEQIELCMKILEGTDDHYRCEIEFPPGNVHMALFGAEMKSLYRRTDGKDANIQYTEDVVFESVWPKRRVITSGDPAVQRIYTE